MKWAKARTDDYRRGEILALPDDTAEVLYHRGRAYCGDQDGTKGFLPASAVPLLVRKWNPTKAKKATDALVAAGLWEPKPGGWHLVGWETEQAEMLEIGTRRATDRERQQRHRRTKRLTLEVEAKPSVLALRDALDDLDMTPSWASLSQEQVDHIADLLDRHGQDRLVATAKAQWRPNNPARHAVAFLPAWDDLRAARARKTRPAWCGECDEKTRMTDEDKPRRCPTCGGSR